MKSTPLKTRLAHILFWSVISAAFIGPGTVTTAASAGTGFGYTLIWALLFSTIACYILQEASARLTAVSGKNLGEAMRIHYSKSAAGRMMTGLVLIAIITGCAAFEAGNILGAVAGISLITGQLSTAVVVLLIGACAVVLLWFGSVRTIAMVLGIIVAFMGICFVITALLIPHDLPSLFAGAIFPAIPAGAEVLVLGLIGTTVVPYNIFLGSGLKHSQTPSEMKLSLLIAIGLGGFISIAVLLTGTAIAGSFTFEALATALTERVGGFAAFLLGFGLFGAGLSSALTAALAAAITARSILAKDQPGKWHEKSTRFRAVWGGVLGVGLFFGLLNLQPVPVIILAQALNGIVLPLIAVLLFLLMNNDQVLPQQHQNGTAYNLLTGFVVYLSVLIGITNVLRALSRAIGFQLPDQNVIIIISIILFGMILLPVWQNFSGRNS